MKELSIGEIIIKKSFYFTVQIIERVFDTKPSKDLAADLEGFDEGTVGREIAECLKKNGLNLIPGFKSHDLKHVLLNFQMTPLDEIRMQAFMLGNGNWSIVSLAIFLYGLILLPGNWKLFLADYQDGRRAIPIKHWSIEDLADKRVIEIRDQIYNRREQKVFAMNKLTIREISQYGSFATIATGIFGMLFCFPFLWSSNIADLVGAGFPFVGGSILTIGGLINLSVLSRRQPVSH